MNAPQSSGQNRAPGLYDEQMQRQLQEKLLIKGARLGGGSALFKLEAPLVPQLAETVR